MQAEKRIVDKGLDKEYAGVLGIPEFRTATAELLLTKDCPFISNNQIASAQTISGTGGLRLIGMFLANCYSKIIYLQKPTWPNHAPIFTASGLECREYTYYNPNTFSFDCEGACKDLESIPEGSAVLFQACGHNPTGCDPTKEEWMKLSKLCKERRLLPVFDVVYGFSSGDVDEDAFGPRQFVRDGNQAIFSYSYAKNFGLYGERAGSVLILTGSKKETAAVETQLKRIIRPLWSNPPIHGAHVVLEVLQNADLLKEWKDELSRMADRVTSQRKAFTDAMKACGSNRDWSHVKKQKGWFATTGLSTSQVDRLRAEFGVYMQKDGRLPLVKLNPKNVEKVAKAIFAVTD